MPLKQTSWCGIVSLDKFMWPLRCARRLSHNGDLRADLETRVACPSTTRLRGKQPHKATGCTGEPSVPPLKGQRPSKQALPHRDSLWNFEGWVPVLSWETGFETTRPWGTGFIISISLTRHSHLPRLSQGVTEPPFPTHVVKCNQIQSPCS